jgi:hypothetical protein
MIGSYARSGALLASVLVLTVAGRAPVWAQTRAEEIARQQEEKARALTPSHWNRAEVFFDQVESGKWFLLTPRGWYPLIGSISPGGGLAGGGGYRHYIGYDSYLDASAALSILGDRRVQLKGHTPNHFGGRADLTGSIIWMDSMKLPFYGLGTDSNLRSQTTFRLTRTYAEGVAALRPVKWFQLRLDGGFDDYTQKRGHGASPSIEDVFTPATAPLLGEHPRYLRGELSASAFWLQSPGYSRSGGLYRFGYEEFNPLGRNGGDTFGFAHTEVVQHVPLLRETWVLSLRAHTDSVVRPSDVVPYFLMPTLGSATTLRGYANGRFRDRHTLLLSSELRWFPNRLGLDMALFVDAGKVAPKRSGLTLHGMKTDYGIGIRFHSPSATALRLDLARGHEGWRLVFASTSPF